MLTLKIRLLKLRAVPLYFLLATAGGSVFLSSERSNAAEPAKDLKPEEPKAGPSTLQLIQPELRTISGPITRSGLVEAYEQTSIYSKVAGFVKTWTADIGDRVKKGQVLATILAPELVEEWETKKAQVKLAEARIELSKQMVKVRQAGVKAAEGRLDATKSVLKSKLPSRDAAAAGVTEAEAELLSKQAAVVEAELAIKVAIADRAVAESEAKRFEVLIGYLTLAAPYDGVIVMRNVNTGDYVSPPSGDPTDRSRSARLPLSRPEPPIYVIARMDLVRVLVDIPDEYANSVEVGSKATVIFPARQDEVISAAITRTSWALDFKSRTLRAEIDLPNPKGELRPGMYASVKAPLKRPRRAWTLPLSAIDESGDKIFFWAFKNGRAVRTEIQTETSDDKWIEITKRRSPRSGGENRWAPLDGSEKVIIGDLTLLEDGKPVKVTNPQWRRGTPPKE